MSIVSIVIYFLSILLFLPLQAQVYEIDSLEECVALVPKNSYLFCDLDDTLMRYPSHLGSESYFKEEVDRIMRAPLQEQDALWRTFHERAALFAQRLPVVPLEKTTVDVLRALQQRCTSVVGLTARSVHHPAMDNWTDCTCDQLLSIGIDLSLSSPSLRFKLEGETPSLYHRGVLFTGRGCKGVRLSQFLEVAKVQEPIAVIDDRLSDLLEIEREVPGVILIWYRRAESSRATYSSTTAALELLEIEGHQGVETDTLGVGGVVPRCEAVVVPHLKVPAE